MPSALKVVTQELKLNPMNVAKLISHTRPDVIHTYCPNGAILLATAIIARALGVRKTIAMVLSMPETPSISLIREYAYNHYDQVIKSYVFVMQSPKGSVIVVSIRIFALHSIWVYFIMFSDLVNLERHLEESL